MERLAKKRNVTLPSGDIFAEGAASKVKKPGVAKKVEPPPPPPKPALPPPRLVKTIKPVPTAHVPEHDEPDHDADAAALAAEGVQHAEPTAEDVHVPDEPAAAPVVEPHTPPVEHHAPDAPAATAAPVAGEPAPAVETDTPHVPVQAEPEVVEPVRHTAAPAVEAPPVVDTPPVSVKAAAPPEPVKAVAPAATTAPAARVEPARPPAPPARSGMVTPTGRIAPSKLRLRIEDAPGGPAHPSSRPAAPATAGLTRPNQVRHAPPVPMAPRPPMPARPVPPRPAGAPMSRPPVSGGPRPLPSQPYRPSQPGSPSSARPGAPGSQLPARPAVGRPAPPPRSGRPAGRSSARRPDSHAGRSNAPSYTPAEPPPVTRNITLAEGMTVKDLSEKLDIRAKDVLKKLLDRRIMMTINTTLDTETATWVAREFGADVQMRSFEEELLEVGTDESLPEDQVLRAPVVTVMGHVDHGKTTLLDAIRETKVAEREAGGITQHIGAYQVTVNNRAVVFLDTPGHEAFTLMRARGAKVTDIVILVVAADDGVMPQTREAIDHARAAGVPIIVAVNKIDKPDANPDRVMQALTELNLMPEQWGGTTVTVPVSAKKRQNIELLLEMILLVSDIGELKANPKLPGQGTVLEAKLDKGRGPVATVLVQNGTLRVGDTIIAGPVIGKVRALIDDRGRPIKVGAAVDAGRSARPRRPAAARRRVPGHHRPGQGAPGRHVPPDAGEGTGARREGLAPHARSRCSSRSPKAASRSCPIVVKADVQGSAEVLADTLAKLSDEKVKVRIIHSGVGAINESDVLLASASNAVIIGFNVRPDRNAAELVGARARRSAPPLGHLQRDRRDEEGDGRAAGSDVPRSAARHRRSARHVPGAEGRRHRRLHGHRRPDRADGRHQGAAAPRPRRGLRRQDRVAAPLQGRLSARCKAGFECGIGFERFNDIKVGDVIEAFTIEKVLAPITI